jgi:hypothetical protein
VDYVLVALTAVLDVLTIVLVVIAAITLGVLLARRAG